MQYLFAWLNSLCNNKTVLTADVTTCENCKAFCCPVCKLWIDHGEADMHYNDCLDNEEVQEVGNEGEGRFTSKKPAKRGRGRGRGKRGTLLFFETLKLTFDCTHKAIGSSRIPNSKRPRKTKHDLQARSTSEIPTQESHPAVEVCCGIIGTSFE
jgi:hypothetical protein